MFSSSPITSWDGAGVFYTFAGGSGTLLWFWVSVILCIVPLFVCWKAEKKAEQDHK
jgi:hypothetical protein